RSAPGPWSISSGAGPCPGSPGWEGRKAAQRREVSSNPHLWNGVMIDDRARVVLPFCGSMLRRYADAVRFLNEFTDYERMASTYAPGDYNLDRMRRLLAAIGNPERAFV